MTSFHHKHSLRNPLLSSPSVPDLAAASAGDQSLATLTLPLNFTSRSSSSCSTLNSCYITPTNGSTASFCAGSTASSTLASTTNFVTPPLNFQKSPSSSLSSSNSTCPSPTSFASKRSYLPNVVDTALANSFSLATSTPEAKKQSSEDYDTLEQTLTSLDDSDYDSNNNNNNDDDDSFQDSIKQHFSHCYKTSTISIPPRSPNRAVSTGNLRYSFIWDNNSVCQLDRQASIQESLGRFSDYYYDSSSTMPTPNSQETFDTSVSGLSSVYTDTSIDQVVQSFITEELSILDSFGNYKSDSTTNITNTTSDTTRTKPSNNVQSPVDSTLSPTSSTASNFSKSHDNTSPASSVVDHGQEKLNVRPINRNSNASHYSYLSSAGSTSTVVPPPAKLRKSSSLMGRFKSLTSRRRSQIHRTAVPEENKVPMINMKFGEEK